MSSSSPALPPNSLMSGINPSKLDQPWKAFVNVSRFDLAGFLLWLSSLACTGPFWLALLAFLYVILLSSLSSLCWFFSVTGRLPSFSASHSGLLASLVHWSTRTSFPLLPLGPKWSVGGSWGAFEEVTQGTAGQKAFQLLSTSLASVTGASHSNGNLTKCSNLTQTTALEGSRDTGWIMNFIRFTKLVPSDNHCFIFTAKKIEYAKAIPMCSS